MCVITTGRSFNALPPAKLGQAASLANFSRQLGGAFGVGGLAMALDLRTVFHGDALTMAAATSSAGPDLLRDVRGLVAGAGLPANVQAAVAQSFFGDVIAAQAYAEAFRDTFYLVGVVFAIALVPALFLGGKKSPQQRTADEAKAVEA